MLAGGLGYPEVMPTATLETCYEIAEDVLVRHIDGESVVLDLKSQHYFGLDPVGTRVWQLLMEHRRPARVVEKMLDEFEVERETAARHVAEFVEELAGAGLIAAVDDPP